MSRRLRSQVLRVAVLIAAISTLATAAQAQPTFSKAFQPDTIGPGSVATLIFTLTEVGGVLVTDLAFSDTLPAGVTIASPPRASTTCIDGVVVAPGGGGTITLSGGRVGAFASCRVFVDVTSSTPGVHMNVSGDLTSSAGNSGTASADLTVATDRPGFAKSFSPSTAVLGSRATLTFTVDNTANASLATNLTFSDTLPAGLSLADPANASTTCTGGAITAIPGGGTVAYGPLFFNDASVAALASCTVSVDVVAGAVGGLDNVSSELSSFTASATRTSGKASARLTVQASEVALIKSFTDDPVAPGGAVTLSFTILNFNREATAVEVGFTDDLDATLSGLAVSGPLPTDPCGAGSSLAGTSTLTLSDGVLGPEGSCTFSVTLAVPAGATPGVYTNTTGPIFYNFGELELGLPASDALFVFAVPLLTKTFLDSPVTPGDSTRMEFTVTNTSATSAASDIALVDDLTAFLPFPVSVTLPAMPCGGGSSIVLISLGTDRQGLSLTGGDLAAGASCTFEVVLDLPVGLASNTYTNTTGAITATVDGTAVTGQPASADLEVVAAPSLSKSFTDDPVQPGGTVTLELTLEHDPGAPADATGIAFTDDLGAVLTGLSAVGLPLADVCGAGSQISGTSVLSFTGGTLAPDESCTFQVTLQVPAAAASGSYLNTTSTVSATVSGLAVTSRPGEDTLRVAEVLFTKTFLGDPVIAGDVATLRFSIANDSPTQAATGIFFSDDLDNALSGLVAEAPLPAMPCGAGSTLTGTAFLQLTGGDLAAGASCTFDVTVRVPVGAPDGVYGNLTGPLNLLLGGTPIAVAPAADDLAVSSTLLALAKTFLTNPTFPGNTVDLELTVTNLDPARSATGIAFTDDLNAALAGLAAVGLPVNGVCGAGSQIAGTTVLSLTGGSLGPGASCTFQVTVQVPAMAGATTAVNTTSSVTGTINGLAVDGAPATDTLMVQAVDFSKAFAGPTTATGTVVLTFTIENLDGVNGVGGLGFIDDLDAVLSGLAATGLPQVNVCGAGSLLSGTSVLSLSSGNLGPGGTCSFPVTLQVPAGAAPGGYLNTTSGLSAGGLAAAAPASDTLGIEPPPTFAKIFAPDAIGLGGVSTLTFTLDNAASAVAASGLDFTDALPAGSTVASPANASTTCGGGTITATPGAGTVAYTGGSVAAGASCTVQADVAASATGSLLNTSGDLTSSSGNSGPASATLTVNPQPGFGKIFEPASIAAGGVSTLRFVIHNGGSTVDATGLDFTDVLPAGLVVASPANAATECTGGTITAVPGSGTVAYSGGAIGAGASCMVAADVTAAAPGVYDNLSGPLTSSLGSSGTAEAILDVVAGDLAMTKSFVVNPVLPGGSIALELTITNLSPDFTMTAVSFSDDLDAVVPGLVAAGLPAADVCGAGSQLSGTSVIALTGGSLAPGASCTFSAALVVPASAPLGTFPCITSDLTATAQGVPVSAPPASADLTIDFLQASKSFAAGAVNAGTETTLSFTLENPDPTNPATDVSFADDLNAVIPGLEAVDTPLLDVCGAGSQLSGTSLLMLTGGSLPAGGSCTFDVTLLVPSTTPSGDYTNLTSPLAATVGGSPVAGGPASAAEDVVAVIASVIAIPTLGGWGLLLLAGLLTAAALWRMRSA